MNMKHILTKASGLVCQVQDTTNTTCKCQALHNLCTAGPKTKVYSFQ